MQPWKILCVLCILVREIGHFRYLPVSRREQNEVNDLKSTSRLKTTNRDSTNLNP